MAKPIEHPEGALTIWADLPQEDALRFYQICEVSGLSPADFLRAAVLSTMKRYEQQYNIRTPKPHKPSLVEDLTYETTSKKKRTKAQTSKGQLDLPENQTLKLEHQTKRGTRSVAEKTGAPKKKGWPKGKPRKPKPTTPLGILESVMRNITKRWKGNVGSGRRT